MDYPSISIDIVLSTQGTHGSLKCFLLISPCRCRRTSFSSQSLYEAGGRERGSQGESQTISVHSEVETYLSNVVS